jgi:hypothetical protein
MQIIGAILGVIASIFFGVVIWAFIVGWVAGGDDFLGECWHLLWSWL